MKDVAPAPVSPRPRRHAEWVALVALAASYFAVWPVGHYLIDDDWAYTRSLQILHEEGRAKILDWNPMTLVGQLYWGWLWTQCFGFSFTVAKLSTAALAFLECVAAAALLRRLELRESVVVAAVLVLVFQPLHFFQSFLFATDVPTIAATALGLLAYSRGLSQPDAPSLKWVAVGSLCVAWAWLIRQPGILLAPVVGLYLLCFERRWLGSWRVWLAAFAAPTAAVLGFLWWYHQFHGATYTYLEARPRLLESWSELTPATATGNAYSLLAYAGFFLLPLLAAIRGSAVTRRRWLVGTGVAILLLGAFVWRCQQGEGPFPYVRNKITEFGFLPEHSLLVGARPVLISPTWWWVASGLFLAGAIRWGSVCLTPAPRSSRGAVVTWRLASLLLGIQLAYLFLSYRIVFDRHLLLILPTALVVFLGALGARARLQVPLLLVVLIPYAFYAVAGTHDVHALSRAAYAAGHELLADGVRPRRVDGGYAFTGFHMYEKSRAEITEEGRSPLARSAEEPWYLHRIAPRVRAEYMVSLAPPDALPPSWNARRPNLVVQRTWTYASWWPPGRTTLYLLRDTSLPPRKDD